MGSVLYGKMGYNQVQCWSGDSRQFLQGWWERTPTHLPPTLSEGPGSLDVYFSPNLVPQPCCFPSAPTARAVLGPKLGLTSMGLGGSHWVFGSGGALGFFASAKPLLPPFPGLELARSLFWVRSLDLAVSLVSSLVLVTGTLEPEAPRDRVTQGAFQVAATLSLRGPYHGRYTPSYEFGFILLPSNYSSRMSTRQLVVCMVDSILIVFNSQ